MSSLTKQTAFLAAQITPSLGDPYDLLSTVATVIASASLSDCAAAAPTIRTSLLPLCTGLTCMPAMTVLNDLNYRLLALGNEMVNVAEGKTQEARAANAVLTDANAVLTGTVAELTKEVAALKKRKGGGSGERGESGESEEEDGRAEKKKAKNVSFSLSPLSPKEVLSPSSDQCAACTKFVSGGGATKPSYHTCTFRGQCVAIKKSGERCGTTTPHSTARYCTRHKKQHGEVYPV